MRKSILQSAILFLALALSLESCSSTPKSSKKNKKAKKTLQSTQQAAPAVPAPQPEQAEVTKVVADQAKAAYVKQFGTPQITFIETQQGLMVNISTDNLELTSASMEDLDNYCSLFSNPKLMEQYAEGKPRSKKQVKERLAMWASRWNAQDPFSALVVRKKSNTLLEQDEFIGHIVLGHAYKSAQDASLAGLSKESAQHQQYAYEAAGALVFFYAPELVQKGYKLPEGMTLQRITATARPDNTASVKLLEKLGFQVFDQGMPYGDGVVRDYYARSIEAEK